jgi:hypothetical protein
LRDESESSRRFVTMGFRSPNGSGPYTAYLRAIYDGKYKLVLNGVGVATTSQLRGPGDSTVAQAPQEIARLKQELAKRGF